MKKVIQAYRTGKEGQSLPEGASLSARAAHALGTGTLRRSLEADMQLARQKQQELAEATERAQGPNRQVLQIVTAAAEIPHQSATEPGWSTVRTDKAGNRSLGWVSTLSSGVDKDPTRPGKTPVVGSLGALRVNGQDIVADNVHFVVNAPLDRDGTIGAATSSVHINSRPFDNVERAQADPDATGGARIDFGADGSITGLAVERDNAMYMDQDLATVRVNTDEFLAGVQAAVDDTVEAYRGIPDRM